ncbi:MAG: DUF4157 domain-containing protein [Marinilabiliales bacterium]|nr:DUF4157 domain-containing protein [Marinilabiliales bacterium]
MWCSSRAAPWARPSGLALRAGRRQPARGPRRGAARRPRRLGARRRRPRPRRRECAQRDLAHRTAGQRRIMETSPISRRRRSDRRIAFNRSLLHRRAYAGDPGHRRHRAHRHLDRGRHPRHRPDPGGVQPDERRHRRQRDVPLPQHRNERPRASPPTTRTASCRSSSGFPASFANGGGGHDLRGHFRAQARFQARCNCADYEYRQFIRGRFTRTRGVVDDLSGIFNLLPAGRLTADFREDGDTSDPMNYGHRANPADNNPEDRYINDAGNEDQANGCRYLAKDFPGANLNAQTGDSFDALMQFRGVIRRSGREVPRPGVDRHPWRVQRAVILSPAMGLEHVITPRRTMPPARCCLPRRRCIAPPGRGCRNISAPGAGRDTLTVQRDGEADLLPAAAPAAHALVAVAAAAQPAVRPVAGTELQSRPGYSRSAPPVCAAGAGSGRPAAHPAQGVDWREAIGSAPSSPVGAIVRCCCTCRRAAAAGARSAARSRGGRSVQRLLPGSRKWPGCSPMSRTGWEADVERAWNEAGSGGQVLIVSWIGVTAAALGTGAILSPGLRGESLNLIDGTVIPVPKLPWLGLEYTSKGGASFGAHVDLGLLLHDAMPILGFGPAPSMTPFYGPYDTPRGLFPDWGGTVPGLQRDSADAAPPRAQDLSRRLRAARGGGEPLPEDVRGRLERHAGAELSAVRGTGMREPTPWPRDLHARAFTLGSDVFFRQGPCTIPGRTRVSGSWPTRWPTRCSKAAAKCRDVPSRRGFG